MSDPRPWLKQRLPASAEAQEALAIMESWRHLRTAAMNIVRAVRLFASLSQGRTDLLLEYFPLLAAPLSIGRPSSIVRRPAEPVAVTYVEKSDEDNQTDFAESLGLDALEF